MLIIILCLSNMEATHNIKKETNLEYDKGAQKIQIEKKFLALLLYFRLD